MKYAVVRIKGHQYKVSEGEEVLVDYLGEEKPEPEILMVVDDEKVTVGKPVVKEAKITIKVLADLEKGEKIHIRKYKSKSRYKKHIGFRASLTRLLIEKITA